MGLLWVGRYVLGPLILILMLLLIVYVKRNRKGAIDVCGACGKGMGEGFCN